MLTFSLIYIILALYLKPRAKCIEKLSGFNWARILTCLFLERLINRAILLTVIAVFILPVAKFNIWSIVKKFTGESTNTVLRLNLMVESLWLPFLISKTAGKLYKQLYFLIPICAFYVSCWFDLSKTAEKGIIFKSKLRNIYSYVASVQVAHNFSTFSTINFHWK